MFPSIKYWLTFFWRMFIPCGPELDGEERSPADDINQHDDHRHLQRLHSSFGHTSHPAGPRWKGDTDAAMLLNLLEEVNLDGSADAHLTHNHCNNRQNKNDKRNPSNVCLQPPWLNEIGPAVEHSGFDLGLWEDKNLWQAAQHRNPPRGAQRDV